MIQPILSSNENVSECIRNYNTDITEVTKRKLKTNCSKFQGTSLLLRFWNVLSYLHPILHALPVDCDVYFKTQPKCVPLWKYYQLPRQHQYLDMPLLQNLDSVHRGIMVKLSPVLPILRYDLTHRWVSNTKHSVWCTCISTSSPNTL